MNLWRLLFTLLLFYASHSFAELPSKDKIDDFIQKLSSCCREKNIEGLKKLSSFKGIPRALIDTQVCSWEVCFKEAGSVFVFKKIDFYPIEDYLQRPNVNKDAILNFTQPRMMNGHAIS